MNMFVRTADAVSRTCGVIAALLVIALIVLMLYDVAMRYLANAPTLWGFDVNTYLMGSAFVLSIAYGLSHDTHVRVDLLYSPRTRPRLAWVDLVGFGLLALPVLALSGFKAHVILTDYLRLSTAPGWRRGFDLGLTLLILAFAGLALAA